MQFTLALMPTLLGLALAAPQGVTDKLTPTGAAPAGCTGSFDGKFEITVAQVTEKKRSLPEKREACGTEGTLVMSLSDGTTEDAQGRTGYIASNYQFQFDKPAQAGALFTSGFSVCEDNLLALGSSKTFYRCLSGDFYNLYDRSWAEQCEPVNIIAVSCGEGDSATQAPDGQVVGTTVVQTTIVTALTDGQPQVVTTEVPVPICQIGDGQVQVVTTPCASITSSVSTYVPVSEYTDGQIQVTPPGTSPVSTATATTAAPSSPETTAPAGTSAASGSAPSSSAPAPSSSAASSPAVSSSAGTSAASSATSTAPASTSAPATGGSSRVAAGSVGALVVGLMIAVVCL